MADDFSRNNLIMDNKGRLKKDILTYSVIFVIAALACYIFYITQGKTFVKYVSNNADGLSQTYTAYVSLKHMMHELFSGNGMSAWTWALGLGGDTFEYYGFKIFNPLTYFIIAFPDNMIDIGYSIANVIREYLAGLMFLLCMREVGLKHEPAVAGAVSYAFSGWVVEIVLNQGSFENAAIIFPLLIMGTEKVFKKKSPVLFIVSVALCLSTGVTWTYISGIMVVLYYFVRYHDYHHGESIGEFFKNLGEYVLYGIVGILISAPFMLSILCSMGGATTDTKSAAGSALFSLRKYCSIPEGLFKYSEVGATSYSYICISILCICLLPMLIKRMRERSTIAWMAIGLFFISLFPITSKVLNGFSYPAGRWYYVLTFFLIWSTMECFTEETISSRKNQRTMLIWISALAGWTILMYVLGIGPLWAALGAIFEVACGWVLVGIAYLYYNKNISRQLLKLAAIAVLVAAVAFPVTGKTFPGIGDFLDDFMNNGESAERISTCCERVVPEIRKEDKSFFRSDQTYRCNPNLDTKLKVNANLVFNNNSIYTYSSLVDSRWTKFNQVLGNNIGYFARTTVVSNDNRAPMDYLLGVKYFLGNNEYEPHASEYAAYGYSKRGNVDGVDVLSSSHSIGLGTAVNQYITESELMEYPKLVRDQVMLQAVVVPDDAVDKLKGIKHADKNSIKTYINEVMSMDAGELVIDDDNSTIAFDTPKIANSQIVVSFEGLRRASRTYEEAVACGDEEVSRTGIGVLVNRLSYRDVGNFRLTLNSGNIEKYAYYEPGSPRGFVDVPDFNINMGLAENIGDTITVDFSEVGTYTYDAIRLYAIPMTAIDDNAASLERSSLNITDFDSVKGDRIKGEVNASGNSVLYLSIPYDRGWEVYVDGTRTPTMENVNVGFTGVIITAGKHEVELKYSHWGMKYAIAGTVLGIIGLVLIVAVRKKRKTA